MRSIIILLCCLDQGTTTVVKNKTNTKRENTIGRIKLIKSLSPNPKEFITIASELLYRALIDRIIAKNKDNDKIKGTSLIILKPINGNKSTTGMPCLRLSLITKTNWLPNTTKPITVNTATSNTNTLRIKYLARSVLLGLKTDENFIASV